ncbi:pyridoxal phosphate-dependent transferase [Thelonectria olida]|uniref:Pyridoxal phosphate-dependent transferase n=1 Tax=Thelonectria olida TaxID=1576542 RepID=A0A9P9ALZ2_9HYPO|nr:pyridoxal phosphate-dependent transferase [Thelonectria olida]
MLLRLIQWKHINLQLWWPSPSLFPSAELKLSANAVLTDFDAATAALVYGPNRGHTPLRKQLAQWLGLMYHNYSQAIEEDLVCIAGGASQNLANTLLRFTDPTYTRRIGMVEPTYFLACPVFKDCGRVDKMRGVPEDDQGIDLDFLKKAWDEADANAARIGGMDTPKFKTPSSGYEKIHKHGIYTMSLEHRHDLVRLAIEYDALIISDDVYDFLCWPQEMGKLSDGVRTSLPPRLVDINRKIDPKSKLGNTVSNGSFSNIIAPGTRVSWAQGTLAFANFLASTGSTGSGGNPGHLASTFVWKMVSSGALENHIRNTLIPCYSARYYGMVKSIRENLVPLGVRINAGNPFFTTAGVETAGGFLLSITLPKGLSNIPVLSKIALEKYDFKFAYGKMFERASMGFGNTVRLCWAFHENEAIVKGIKRIRDMLVEQRESVPTS